MEKVTTHTHNVILDQESRCYVRNEANQVLLQRISDEKLVYINEDIVFRVFGKDGFVVTPAPEVNENQLQNDETPSASLQSEGRTVWTYEATCALIAAVENYKDAMHHPVKRKHVWESISNELLSQGIECPHMLCKKKWLNLVKTYKNVKDVITKTGRGPTRFMFFQQIDEILGKSPSISSPHTIDSLGVSQPDLQPQPSPSASSDTVERDEEGETTNTTVEELSCEEGVPKKRKKTNIMKLREEVAAIKEKLAKREAREEQKLSMLERKLQLEERKVKALEQLVKINMNPETNIS